MAHECGACGGSGLCQNRFHDVGGPLEALRAFAEDAVDTDCPACGEDTGTRGNCSVCGGSGIQDDGTQDD